MSDPKITESQLPTCGLCGEPAKGYAAIGEQRYCHEGTATTCYMRAVCSNVQKAITAKAVDELVQTLTVPSVKWCSDGEACANPDCTKHPAAEGTEYTKNVNSTTPPLALRQPASHDERIVHRGMECMCCKTAITLEAECDEALSIAADWASKAMRLGELAVAKCACADPENATTPLPGSQSAKHIPDDELLPWGSCMCPDCTPEYYEQQECEHEWIPSLNEWYCPVCGASSNTNPNLTSTKIVGGAAAYVEAMRKVGTAQDVADAKAAARRRAPDFAERVEVAKRLIREQDIDGLAEFLGESTPAPIQAEERFRKAKPGELL